jgi:hypothetical protein
MNWNRLRFTIALVVGALIGIGATFWFFAQTTRHVSTLQPPDVALPDDAPSVPDRNRVMGLVCRDVISAPEFGAKGTGKGPSMFFLAIGDSLDPAPELLATLSDLPMSVQPYSSGKSEDGRLKDKLTGTTGPTVVIRRMWMRTRNEVYVRVRLDSGSAVPPREWICTVARVDGQWKVTHREPLK